ncbi:DUF3016 domain-containing protein [Luteimonas terricola]|uniref:DUF3016 domain-containing protein n=1 Tax=Luteimonas terricola TaxID=645597 RepID=A0ABQ2ENP3_9GAMM|nr:DUF3016 domain-containing protein [Luteimonas terricola]GGK14669.1 hypothetical protein GCM10011394_24900 [Luteimonas terricola]
MPRPRHIQALVIGTLLAFALAGPAIAADVTDADYPRSLEQDGPVAVSWADPSGFTEIRHSRNRFEARRGDWVRDIARHLARRAGDVLGPGERLEVEITDIKRAGDFEPGAGRGDHVRVVRDIYPPRIHLSYSRHDAAGNVVDGGERELTDLGFLQRGVGMVSMSDPLRHEKRLIDDWVRRDLAGPGR